MTQGYACPNAEQEKVDHTIKCKLGETCAFQRHCWIVGGYILSSGSETCKGRNKKPKSETKIESKPGFFKKIFSKFLK